MDLKSRMHFLRQKITFVKIEIDPYVDGVCGHFAQIGLDDLKRPIDPDTAMV